MNDELSELGGLLSNLTDAGCSVFANLNVNILEAVENSWENLRLNDDFSEVDGVLGDLGEALADITLKLGIWVRN